MKDDIWEFLRSGKIYNLEFGPRTSRLTLLKKFEKIIGGDKKNGVYDILIKDNIIFQMGHGARGMLEAVKIINLETYSICKEHVIQFLNKNNIHFELQSENSLIALEPTWIIYFSYSIKNKENYLSSIVKAIDEQSFVRVINRKGSILGY